MTINPTSEYQSWAARGFSSAAIARLEAERDEAVACLAKIGATWAARSGAEGPNNRVRRGAWTIDGRRSTPAETRRLNALGTSSGYGTVVIEAEAGAWSGSLARLDAMGEA